MNGPGIVWTWGLNDHGQLGIGNKDNALEPIRISSVSNVSAVAAGQYFSMALLSDGTLWAWGDNEYGQLGIGTSGSGSNTPVQVQNFSDKIVRAISCGFQHSLALLSDGTLWAWGHNNNGQLGLGNTTTIVTTPTQVAALGNVSAITAGGHHSFAYLSNGTVWAWGLNGTGQLGIGSISPPITTPTQVTALSNVAAIAAGGYHSLAILSNYRLYAWGANYSGQLGLGNLTDRNSPVLVPQLNNVRAISCGLQHSLALLSDGTLWAFGHNSNGELGLGSTSLPVTTPTQVAALSNVATIPAASTFHSLARLKDGTLRAWGDNTYGELGNGSTIPSSTPLSVLTLRNAITITQSFGWHNLAIGSIPTRGVWWLDLKVPIILFESLSQETD